MENGWIDVSVSLHSGMVHWPDNPPVRIERTQSIEKGDAANVSEISMGAHTGTHIDGPIHFVREGKGLDEMPLTATIGRARVVLTGISGGDRTVEVPGDYIMLGFVLGNKVAVGSVNANRTYFERGVEDMALSEAEYPGWLKRLLTHPVEGLEDYEEMIRLLTEEKKPIKVYVEVNGHV